MVWKRLVLMAGRRRPLETVDSPEKTKSRRLSLLPRRRRYAHASSSNTDISLDSQAEEWRVGTYNLYGVCTADGFFVRNASF